ncbi:Hsp20/alpha crystallin family protein [Rhodopirellula halodulae]|uniref:Hsp20/alpha crystallin family protein n=1 Tax=Rhodopirellula halodulae TaxID=2894198 RepID=UPI001E4C9E9A|nr:Hsp20/alpha crystallin family protein [Rhodopirellula sp. JC737]MCC9654374.1 Hsp20/alpha crystallin family protein [Rhodopirellula sp. JC737]
MSTTLTTQSNESASCHEVQHTGGEEPLRSRTFMPRFDIWEDEQELTLFGDLPGVTPEDLDVEFENRMLTIRGKVASGDRPAKSLQSEYEVGDYQRSFTIGEKIDAANITAELKDGVLTLHLPKVEEAKPRRIEIRSN